MKTLASTALLPQEREAIAEAVNLLKTQFPIEHVILFGSKARGDDDEYSDIDLLLVTSRKLHWKEEKTIVDLLFDVGMKYDVLFSFLCVPIPDWDGGIFTEFPIYNEIMREGAHIL
jgi:predicted nucleotidyltransferase